jgi:hypothetical protein
MTHLADKMKLLAGGTQDFVKQLEDKVDAKLAAHSARQQAVLAGVDTAFATVDSVTADAEAGLASIEEALKGITN